MRQPDLFTEQTAYDFSIVYLYILLCFFASSEIWYKVGYSRRHFIYHSRNWSSIYKKLLKNCNITDYGNLFPYILRTMYVHTHIQETLSGSIVPSDKKNKHLFHEMCHDWHLMF